MTGNANENIEITYPLLSLLTGHGLELGKDLNPIKTHLEDINRLLLNMSKLAKTVSDEYKKEYDLIF